MDYLVSIVIGVLAGITASWLFWFLLSRLKPNLIISKKIAKVKNKRGQHIYTIKVINKSRRKIININAQLYLLTMETTFGNFSTIREIELKRNKVMELSRFNIKDKEANYNWRFVTEKPIDLLLKNFKNSILRFELYAIDSFSGFGRVYTMDYKKEDNPIIEGYFKEDNSIEISHT